MAEPTDKERNVYLSRLLEKAGLASEQRDIAEKVQKVLNDEIHHRTKNMLTMVTAIVRQSMRTATSLAQAESAISLRLVAMGKAHDLLLKADWKTAALDEVLAGAIEQHLGQGRHIALSGPKIEIASAVIVPMTLIFNELCTNATKYGALANENGRVTLNWSRDDEGNLVRFVWRESGGPAVTEPKTRSFGSRLIENALPRQLGGTGTLVFAPTGVEFDLVVPLEKLALPD